MNTPYKKIALTLCYLCFLLSFSQAQESQNNFQKNYVRHRKLTEISQDKKTSKLPDTYIKIINEQSFTRNDSLFIYFQALVQGRVIKSGESLSLIPEYQRGEDIYDFPAILINDKKRVPYYNRERALASPESYWQYKPYATIVAKKREQQQLIYDYALPLPVSTQKGKLVLKYLKQDCCDIVLEKTDSLKLTHKEDSKKTQKVIQFLAVGYPEYQDKVTYLEPAKEVEKIRYDTIIIHINYPVDKAKVLPSFAGNRQELNKVDSLFRYLIEETNTYTLQAGSITGYASPEDTYDHNLKLSERRALGFYEYFTSKYKHLNLPPFAVKGAGEDWKGLSAAIEKTSMHHKNSVLDIIDSCDIFKGREKKLMDLAWGEPYRYMLRTLFPPLRRIEMTLEYKVRDFSMQETKEVWNTRPRDLSQQELYRLAQATKNKAPLEAAANYFPDDAIANINAASVALVKADLEKAYFYLQKVWEEPKAYNNIGVYYMLKKDYDQAEVFFRKAIAVDEVRANANLKLLENLVNQKDE